MAMLDDAPLDLANPAVLRACQELAITVLNRPFSADVPLAANIEIFALALCARDALSLVRQANTRRYATVGDLRRN
jgi:hypothetical protein